MRRGTLRLTSTRYDDEWVWVGLLLIFAFTFVVRSCFPLDPKGYAMLLYPYVLAVHNP